MSSAPRILVVGLPFFGRVVEKSLEVRGWHVRYRGHPGRSPSAWAGVVTDALRADLVYFVASRADRGSAQHRFLGIRRGPSVIHWVGTDVLLAAEAAGRGQLSQRVVERPVHWTDAPWLVGELASLEIHAEYVPLPVPGLAMAASPLPGRFRVLLYLPVDDFDREVFDVQSLLRLPGAFPEAEFTLVPSPPETLLGPLPPNLKALRWVDDMDALYRETTVIVRLTSHDGMSFMALEALSRGRYVIWTHPIEGGIRASGFDETAARLGELLEAHRTGKLEPNARGIEYTRQNFDPVRVADDLDARLRRLLSRA